MRDKVYSSLLPHFLPLWLSLLELEQLVSPVSIELLVWAPSTSGDLRSSNSFSEAMRLASRSISSFSHCMRVTKNANWAKPFWSSFQSFQSNPSGVLRAWLNPKGPGWTLQSRSTIGSTSKWPSRMLTSLDNYVAFGPRDPKEASDGDGVLNWSHY